jgi:hypothetical protein
MRLFMSWYGIGGDDTFFYKESELEEWPTSTRHEGIPSRAVTPSGIDVLGRHQLRSRESVADRMRDIFPGDGNQLPPFDSDEFSVNAGSTSFLQGLSPSQSNATSSGGLGRLNGVSVSNQQTLPPMPAPVLAQPTPVVATRSPSSPLNTASRPSGNQVNLAHDFAPALPTPFYQPTGDSGFPSQFDRWQREGASRSFPESVERRSLEATSQEPVTAASSRLLGVDSQSSAMAGRTRRSRLELPEHIMLMEGLPPDFTQQDQSVVRCFLVYLEKHGCSWSGLVKPDVPRPRTLETIVNIGIDNGVFKPGTRRLLNRAFKLELQSAYQARSKTLAS